MNRFLLIVVLCMSALAPIARAETTAQALYDRMAPSLVVVRYTYAGEIGRRDLESTGLVVGDDGLVIISMNFTPTVLPDEQMTDFKIIIPSDDEREIAAEFLGRDERTNLSFVKAKDASAHKWTPVKFETSKDAAPKIGEDVMSIGLMPKTAGYKPYLSKATVAAYLNGPVPQVLVTGDGLAATGAPVFNKDGVAVGLVEGSPDQSPLLNDPNPRSDLSAVMNPPRMYVPASDFASSLKEPPSGKPIELPFTGVSQLAGVSKEVSEYLGLKKQPAVQIGDVLAGFPAEKAGIKSGDIIVKLNGEPLERGDSDDETWRILTRKINRFKVGDSVTLTIHGGKDQPSRDVKVELAERPKPANRAARFWAEDLGFTVRDVVFDDTYDRKIPADTTGVVVALIKPNSSAQTARLGNGDMITQFNGQPVKDLPTFKTDYEAFRKDKPKEAVVLEVLRGTNTQVIRIEPPQ